MSFLSTLAKSLTPAAYYSELRKRSVLQGIGFVLLLGLLLSLCLAGFFAKRAYDWRVRVPEYRDLLLQELQSFYPEDLILTWRGGELSTNREGPVILDLQTPKLREVFFEPPVGKPPTARALRHLVTIDPAAAAEDYISRESVILMTRKAAIAPDKNDRTQMLLFSEYPQLVAGFVFDRAMWSGFAAEAGRVVTGIASYYLQIVGVLLLFAAFFGVTAWLIWHLIYLLIFSLILMIVSVLLGRSCTYGECYVLGLFGSAAPLLLTAGAAVFSIQLPSFFFSLVLLGLVGAGILAAPKAQPAR